MLNVKQLHIKHLCGREEIMENKRVGLELLSLNNLIRRYLEFSSNKREIDSVTGNNGWIIGYLAQNKDRDIFQKDVEDHFAITRSTASKVLSLMEKKGLIHRNAVSHDARLKKITLTEKSWEIQNMMREDGQRLERILTKGFTKEEEDVLHVYLTRIKMNLNQKKTD